MTVNFLRDSHHHRVGEVRDASRPAAVFLLEHAVPVDRFAERFLLDEVESLTENAFGSSRCFEVFDLDAVCKAIRRNLD